VDFSTAVSKVLTKNGYLTELRHNPESGMAELRSKKPDLVVLDVMFPESPTAGFAMAREIQGDKALRDIPILMLTAVNQEFPLGFGSKDIDINWMPVQDFVEKPVDFDVLINKVQDLLTRSSR
jgi:DNA-binding response OmpR family regulator